MKLDKLKKTVKTFIDKASYDEALDLIRYGLVLDLFESDLYCYMGQIYKYKNNYDYAYLCYENALEYAIGEEYKNKIAEEMNWFKKNCKLAVKNYSIVVLTYNNLDYTIECIDSIKKYNKLNNHEIIVVDNNSSDGTREWIQEQNGIRYVLNEENKGFPAGCNQGMLMAKETNDIFLLNNDTLLMPNSIFTLRMGLYSNEKVGAASSVSNSAAYQRIQEKFKNISDYFIYSIHNNIPDEKLYDCRLKLTGFALFLKRTVLNEVGLLDEQYTPGNYEDDDLGLRITKAGYRNILCKDSFIYHHGHKSFGNNPDWYYQIINTNGNKFKNKWGFDPLESLCFRNDLIELIDKPRSSEIKILEVGCACGGTLLELKNIYPNAEVYGLEINKAASEVAGSFAEVTIGNVEEASLDYEKETFDYIIFADVLQYLKSPLKTAERMKEYLKQDGSMLACVTNVLNYKVIKDMINGRWAGEDKDFLGNSKISFFTRESFERMFKEAGYAEVYTTSLANMPENVEDEKFVDNICKLSENSIKDELLNYEYYIKAQKTVEDGLFELKNDLNIIVKELDKDLNNDTLIDEFIKIIKMEYITPEQLAGYIEDKVKLEIQMFNILSERCLREDLEEYARVLNSKASRKDITGSYED